MATQRSFRDVVASMNAAEPAVEPDEPVRKADREPAPPRPSERSPKPRFSARERADRKQRSEAPAEADAPAEAGGAPALRLITTTAELEAVCARFAAETFVTVDTEFHRETTYWPKLCVLQMAGADEVVLVDALSPALDLGPFVALMANTAVVKVFHAARQDVEICVRLCGAVPTPIFDTQVAATVLGFGDQVSYDQLVQRLVGVEIDKSQRFTDWAKRPLSTDQLTYAAADVIHLRPVYERLISRLEKRGRLQWVIDEMALLGDAKAYVTAPEDAWQRLKGRIRKPKPLAVLMEVAAWRETEAQTRDVPRSRVLKDEAVQDIAERMPTSAKALSELRSIPAGFERSKTGQDIIAAVERGLARDAATLPRVDDDRGPGAPGALTDMLKVLAKKVCEEAGVAPKVLATVDEIEALAADDAADVPALKGWRRELFGEKALKLKRGELSLSVEKGRVVVEERTPKAAPARPASVDDRGALADEL